MKHSNVTASLRQQKVAQLINIALISCFNKGNKLDPYLLENKITITKVDISPDLRVANCGFLPFNYMEYNSDKVNLLLKALENSKYAIRDFVTKEVQLRYSPEIRFHYDHSFLNAEKITQMIQNVSKSDS